MFDPGISVNDPLFWLHHANVDRYFWIWQLEHPTTNIFGGDEIQVTENMMPYQEPLSRGMEVPDSSAYYCYKYTASVQPIGSKNLKKREYPTTTSKTYPSNAEKLDP
jgi:hypothetical protein